MFFDLPESRTLHRKPVYAVQVTSMPLTVNSEDIRLCFSIIIPSGLLIMVMLFFYVVF